MPITHSFHPLPDRDRSRIASGLSVRRLPPVHVTVLLILWVTVSGDTRNVLVEMIGIEPIVTEVGGVTVPCHTIAAASPCLVLDSGVEPLLCG